MIGSNSGEIGPKGEQVAVEYLKANGFSVIARNVRLGRGELDIVARQAGTTHFFEVKTVSCENIRSISPTYRPEENVHPRKLKNIASAVESYLSTAGSDPTWEFGVICVFLDEKSRKAKIRILKNIVL